MKISAGHNTSGFDLPSPPDQKFFSIEVPMDTEETPRRVGEFTQARNDIDELFARVKALEARFEFDEPDPPAAPYVPDFTLIPDQLAKYAEADESAEDFRKRAFSILFRFGIAEGENFEGGGEPLSPEEKIRLLPMLIANFAAGNWLNLTEDLKP